MKKIIIAVIITAIFTFIVTENYMINHMEVTENKNGYIVTIFGNNFLYK